LFGTASPGAGRSIMWVALAAPALAVIGALAVSTFVKLIGVVFAGSARTHAAQRAHEAGRAMLAPMAILAVGCIAIGVAPVLVASSIVQRAVTAWEPAASQANFAINELAPLRAYSVIAVALTLAIFAAAGFLLRRRLIPFAKASTWGCGYARPTPRIQYTGSSFADFVTGLLAWALMPRQKNVQLRELFPHEESYSSHTGDVVLDRGVLPSFGFIQRLFSFARPLQRGPVQVYLLYVLVIVLVLLLFAWW
jgi:hydrogenase-4 component B